MTVHSQRYGDLDCVLVDTPPPASSPETSPEWLVVLCHGFGAGGEDLVPVAEVLAAQVTAAGTSTAPVRFVCPAAPLDLTAAGYYGARAWWMLDMDRIQKAAMEGSARDLRSEDPEGLPLALEQLQNTVEAIAAESSIPHERIILAGFSQGSMIATELALRFRPAPHRLWVFSGTLLAEPRWREMMADTSFPVFVSHGRTDAVLPFVGAEALRDALTEHEFPVDFFPFDGGHTIPRESLPILIEHLLEAVETTSDEEG